MAGTGGSSLNCETIEEYQSDARIACKYGVKCYQKNPIHVTKYKHPPKPTNKKGTTPKTAKIHKKAAAPFKRGREQDARDDHVSDASSGKDSPKRKRRGSIVDESNAASASFSQEEDKLSNLNETKTSVFESEPELPPSPCDLRESIRQKFLFEMPEDFYSFWDFCQSINGAHPALALKDFGYELVGPYDALSSHFKVDKSKRKQSLFLLHWRYYYDPPGFQTVLKGDDKKQFHLGYFRDNPKSLPAFIASNCAAKDGVFTPVAENMFGAVNSLLIDIKKSSNPFLQTKVSKIQKALQDYANDSNITLAPKTQAMKQRDRKTVCKTFNGLGLLVPVEKKTEVGYRELIETDAHLKRILNKIVDSEQQDVKDKALDQLQQIITAANIANDECDFGTSVELGLDLFAFGGSDFEESTLQLLTTGYNLLGYSEFAKVAEVHIRNRMKGSNLNMLHS